MTRHDRLLHETHIYLHHQIKKWEEILQPHHMAKIFTAVFIALYLDYEMSKEFHPQLEDRAKALKNLFGKLEKSGLDRSISACQHVGRGEAGRFFLYPLQG